ncbi:hypothetical protein ABKV19_000583 [Rosa sericea]
MAANVDNPNVSSLQLIVVYPSIGFSATFILLFRSLLTVVLGLEASKSLFSQLLNSLFRAPMSFYDSTPLGRILSRVSSDLSIVDLDIPFSLVFACGATINAYSNLRVLAAVTWQVLFVSIPMVFLAIQLQKYYFSTAKELMRINGTTKSFVANHLAESVSGAITIRAFNEEDRFLAKNFHLIDINASPFFHSFAANEWLIQRLEIISAAVLASAALWFIGMALSYGLSLNMSLIYSIQNQCTIANYIISVERLNQYTHVPSEAPEVIEGNRPPPNWPVVGKVEIQNLQCFRISKQPPLVPHQLIQNSYFCKNQNNSIMLEKKADEKVILLSEEHKREKNELFRTIIELEKQLDVKTALALEIERIRGALLLIKQMHEDGDLQGRNKMNKIEELLKKKEEDLTMVELIVKEWISNDEIQEAQKELIIGLWDSSNQAFIHVKRVGVDINPFQTATSRNFFKEANIELLELWSLWADYTRDESWHPFKVIVDKVGNAKRFIIQ